MGKNTNFQDGKQVKNEHENGVVSSTTKLKEKQDDCLECSEEYSESLESSKKSKGSLEFAGKSNEGFDIKSQKKLSPTREIVYTLLLYAVLYVISFGILILLIRLPLLKGMHVLMYRGIVMIVLAGIISSVLLVLFKKLRKITWLSAKDVVLVFILTCSINMVFFTLIPVTVERSVSVFMLSYMDTYSAETENTANVSGDGNLNGHFTQDQIADIFVDKYVNEYGAFGKRFDEQLTTGSIEQNADGTYSITDKGRFIVKMFRLISDVFDTDKRLVEP